MKLSRKIINNIQLKDFNSLKIYQNTDYFIDIKKSTDLIEARKLLKEKKIKHVIVGQGTNLIIKEKSFKGLVIKNSLREIKEIKKNSIKISSGFNWDKLIIFSLKNNLYGLENLSGIPGTVGASPIQNIGAYGEEVSSFIKEIEVYNFKTGCLEVLSNEACQFGYRSSIFQKTNKYFIKTVVFELKRKFTPNLDYDVFTTRTTNPHEIRDTVLFARRNRLENYRNNPNVGSFFKNPIVSKKIFKEIKKKHPEIKYFYKNSQYKLSAAWIIESLGWKGKKHNKALVSSKHSLILLNEDKTSKSILDLAYKIKKDVKKHFRIELEIEPVII